MIVRGMEFIPLSDTPLTLSQTPPRHLGGYCFNALPGILRLFWTGCIWRLFLARGLLAASMSG